MRALVLGAGGQLGRDLTTVFSTRYEVVSFEHAELDIADAEAVNQAFREHTPSLVLNAAAYTNVEGAEDDREGAYRTNETGARIVAECAARMTSPIVYFSTDFVFDGSKRTPYEPDDPIAPQGVYAESKAAGERATAEANPAHFIVRTAWLYGVGGNNFVEKILRAAASRPSLRVVTDEIGSPTYTRDLAEGALALSATQRYGVYHAVNEGFCSRFEFARTILNRAGLTTSVESCLASEFPSKAPRPHYSVLSNARLAEACQFAMPAWQDALDRYMAART